MKNRVITILALVASLCCLATAKAAEDTNSAASELKALVSKIQNKLQEGKKNETDLAPEVKEFDGLIEKYKAEKTDDTAQIIFMKAMLYLEVLDDMDKGAELIQQLKQDYPETKAGKSADGILDSIKQQAAAKKIQRTLVEGAKFPEFEEKDLDGKLISVAKFKGKVLLVDFWATWCAPCFMELPNILKAYEKHHDKGFEVIGVSLDQDEARLKDFIKRQNMSWQQCFDGKGWEGKLVQKYGVQKLPTTFLLDGEGKILAKDLRGEDLVQAVGKALGNN